MQNLSPGSGSSQERLAGTQRGNLDRSPTSALTGLNLKGNLSSATNPCSDISTLAPSLSFEPNPRPTPSGG